MPKSKPIAKELTTRILLNTSFNDLYCKLILNEGLTSCECEKILAVAVILINQDHSNLNHLGYRIVLAYANVIGDYRPLYDVAINNGLIPVAEMAKKLISSEEERESFFSEFIAGYTDIYKKDGIVLTEQQYLLNEFFNNNRESSVSVVAPTSYGKSELIMGFIRRTERQNICIVVPSKSLLAQTKKRVIDAGVDWVDKVITHPEMYSFSDQGYVFVLTQERLSRLLHENKGLKFSSVFVDEAHNLLENGDREVLLASVLSILYQRNKHTSFKFLTPFLIDSSNLVLKHAAIAMSDYRVSEYVKSERFHVVDFRKGKAEFKLYDQFTNKFTSYDGSCSGYFDLILAESLDKNIIYFNRPKNIEEFSMGLAAILDDVECELIPEACVELGRDFDVKYNLISCLKKGVAYHHGSMPDYVKLYVEHLFSVSKSLRYLVSSSTLLEGVNLPIERIFLLENKCSTYSFT